jgi:hypothetical protein
MPTHKTCQVYEEEATMTEEQKSESGIMEELLALGQQLTTAVKALWESEDSRKLRQEIGDGFVELGHQVDTAIKSAQDSEAGQQFSEQVKGAMDKARESDLSAKLEEGLVTGLRELNEGLSTLVSSLQTRAPDEGEPAAEAETEDQTGA